MSCRFPGGAHDPEEFWKILVQGRDCIRPVPDDRWDQRRFYHPHPDAPGYTPSTEGGFLDQVFRFDSNFFGISPREAQTMDPQQRILLELSYEAIDRAGMSLERLNGSVTGVFLGMSTYDWGLALERFSEKTHSTTGRSPAIAANRISYLFNLRGPSMTLDTACSSALVALNQGYRSLLNRECDCALVGAVNLMLDPAVFIGFSRLHMLSPSNRCRAFDSRADGYVRSEGGGVLVLKRLDDALSAGDRIEAVLLASGLNQDGRSSGLTAPNPEAQVELLERLYGSHDLAGRVGYLECHGTGTPVGDPIEARSIGTVLGNPAGLPIGSVKTNIGHLEAAAGMAGVIKAILCLQQRKIPPSLHFQKPPETFDPQKLGVRIPTRVEELPSESVIGVNAFGFGGANAHVILGPAPNSERRLGRASHHLLAVSGKSPSAVKERLEQFRALLQGPGSIEDAVYTAARGSQHPYRVAVTGQDGEELGLELEEAGSGLKRVSILERGPVFVFCGQGAQWPTMGLELWQTEPIFASVLDRCEACFQELGGWSLREVLNQPGALSQLSETAFAQPAIFSLQVGLFELWKSWGVVPSAVVGHSVGEVAAAYAAGIFTLEEATRIIFHRSHTMEAASADGAMLAVQAGLTQVESLLENGTESLEIGAQNGPHSTAVSGPVEDIEMFEKHLRESGLDFKRVPVQYAFHSALMAPVEEPLLSALGELRPGAPAVVMMSSVTGEEVAEGELNASYWWQNVRQTVLFQKAVEQLLERGHRLFLEVGPHPVLAADLMECAHEKQQSVKVLASLRRGQVQQARIFRTLGELWCLGADIDWERFHRHGNLTTLPNYPWQRLDFRSPDRCRLRNIEAEAPSRLLGARVDHGLPTWLSVIDERVHPFVADHRFDGQAMLSASTYIELALQAAAEILEERPVLTDVRFEAPLFLQPDNPVLVQTCLDLAEGSFSISFLSEQKQWERHASGRFCTEKATPRPPAPEIDLDEMTLMGPGWVEAPLRARSLEYGPTFQRLGRSWISKTRVLSEVNWPSEEEFLLHPCGLDACLQSVIGVEDFSIAAEQSVVFPSSIQRIRYFGNPRGKVSCDLVNQIEVQGSHRQADFVVYDHDGVLLSVEGVTWKLPEAGSGRGFTLDSMLMETDWQSVETPTNREKLSGQLVGPGAARLSGFLEPGGHLYLFVAEPEAEPLDQLEALLDLVRRLETEQARLVVVTFGAHNISPELSPHLDQAPLLGFLRAVQLEVPRLRPVLRDLPNEPDQHDLQTLQASLCLDEEGELAIREAGLLARRWRNLTVQELDRRAFKAESAGAGSYRAVVDRPGSLQRVVWREQQLDEPGPGQVLLEVEASGVNFSDVLKGLDLYPVDDRSLGSECVGKVVKRGLGVEAPRLGERVVALGSSLMANRALVAAELTAPCPPGWDAAEASALALVATTASLCLESLAQLKANEKVLIHSATGGVGRAALSIARRIGAEIYATAGSEAKRTQLRELGVSHVYNSRNACFADQLLEDSNGGVDVVLNSLSGRGLEKSLECLRPFGRFVEIGKSDLHANRKLGLRPFKDGIQFLTFDLALWMRHRISETGDALRHAVSGAEAIPTTTYQAGQLPQALQTMAAGQHQGKLAVVQVGHLEVGPPPTREPRLDPEAGYLVSGGMGGLGAALARRLVSYGAGHVVLVGRRGTDTPGAQDLVKELEDQGARVHLVAADVCTLEQLPTALPPLKGIFHAANQMDDSTLLELSRTRLENVYRAKANGAWNLHDLSRKHPIDHFVLFSSVSSALGAAGQANYCAANAYLDALAQYRIAAGLPALCVNWGPIKDVGYLSRNPGVLEHLRALGHDPLTAEECLDILGLFMVLKPGPLMVARADWQRLGASGKGGGAESDSGELSVENLMDFLREQVERVLRVADLENQADRPLRDFGMDSLMAVELRNSIEERLQVQLPIRVLLSGPSMSELLEILVEARCGDSRAQLRSAVPLESTKPLP
jgi:acyl transferase domain-containing protein/acyl carrier protein